MTFDFHIRPITAADNVATAKMIRDIFEEFDIPRQGTVYSDPTTDHLFELFQKKKSIFWIVSINNQIRGCCGIYPTDGLDNNTVELVKFYLHSNTRGKGIGKQLLEKSIQTAKEFGYTKMYLESFPEFKAAITLYEKYGFKRTPHPLGNSGHTACNVWMVKDIS